MATAVLGGAAGRPRGSGTSSAGAWTRASAAGGDGSRPKMRKMPDASGVQSSSQPAAVRGGGAATAAVAARPAGCQKRGELVHAGAGNAAQRLIVGRR